MRASFAIVQDQGRRKRQEDYAAFAPPQAPGQAPDLILLADGMGGHAGGDTASRLAVDTFLRSWRADPESDLRLRLHESLKAANDALDSAITEDPELEGMGCTFVALRPMGPGLTWISVGDSPLWRIRGRAVERLNADHSRGRQLDAMAQGGLISAQDAATDRGRNQLEHALVGEPLTVVDESWACEPVRKGDVVVLASDGLDVLSRQELVRAGRTRGGAQPVADALLRAVLAKGAPNQDNVTIAVLRIDEDPVPSRPPWLFLAALTVMVISLLAMAAMVVAAPRIVVEPVRPTPGPIETAPIVAPAPKPKTVKPPAAKPTEKPKPVKKRKPAAAEPAPVPETDGKVQPDETDVS